MRNKTMNVCAYACACVCLAILVGCGTAKKIVDVKTDDASAMQMQCKTDSVAYSKTIVDTTTTDKGFTLYTEIVFTPIDTTTNTPPPEVTVGVDGGIQVKGGNIQSIRQYAHETEKTNAGKAETEVAAHVERADSVAVNQEHHQAIKEQPADDPHKWRYIWRILATILAVAILVCILIFRNKIMGWLRNFLGGFARIWK